jgi:uncharacterized protein (DUF952 family)
MADSPLFKILDADAWAHAGAVIPPAPVDEADGFIHLSALDQVRETARKHFRGRSGLVLLRVDATRLAPGTLRWEPSRGGAPFPHVYGDLPAAAVTEATPLPELAPGEFDFPEDVP